MMGPRHVDAVRRGGHAEIVAVADADGARAEAAAKALAIPRWTTDIATLLGDDDVDVIHICTPNQTHVALACSALEAGKHVVIEKPMATDMPSARRLGAVFRSQDRHVLVTFTYRGYPQVRAARSLVASGEAGKLRLIHGSYLQDWLSEPDDYNWRIDPALGGPSRAVADIGMHWFDLAEFVSGARVVEILADFATLIPTRYRPAHESVAFSKGTGTLTPVSIHTEDAATMLLRFEGGARGAVVVSQISAGHRNDLALEIAASHMSLAWRQEDPELLWLGTRADRRILDRQASEERVGVPDLPAGHPEGWAEALRDLMRPFYAAIAADLPVDKVPAGAYPSLDDGLRSAAFVDAALRSDRSGRWEPLRVDEKAGVPDSQEETDVK